MAVAPANEKYLLPHPECELGYTAAQVEQIMGAILPLFSHWFYGQTGAICEGVRYNRDTDQEEESCGGVSHGPIVYPWDVRIFLDQITHRVPRVYD